MQDAIELYVDYVCVLHGVTACSYCTKCIRKCVVWWYWPGEVVVQQGTSGRIGSRGSDTLGN